MTGWLKDSNTKSNSKILTQWLPGMYVMLSDFEDKYDLAVVEDWMRDVDDRFIGYKDCNFCIGNLDGDFDYWVGVPTDEPTTRITPTQALEIVRNSRGVK